MTCSKAELALHAYSAMGDCPVRGQTAPFVHSGSIIIAVEHLLPAPFFKKGKRSFPFSIMNGCFADFSRAGSSGEAQLHRKCLDHSCRCLRRVACRAGWPVTPACSLYHLSVT